MARKVKHVKGVLRVSGMRRIDLRIMQRLLKFMQDAQLTELDIEMEGVKVRLRKGGAPVEAAPAPVAMPALPAMIPVAAAPVPAAVPAPTAASVAVAGEGGAPATVPPIPGGPVIKSPMVGTFYRAPSPTSPPFVNAGDVIKEGQTLCIIEAMKLMNEVKAEQAGKIVKILAENGHPVEFDQVLFELERT